MIPNVARKELRITARETRCEIAPTLKFGLVHGHRPRKLPIRTAIPPFTAAIACLRLEEIKNKKNRLSSVLGLVLPMATQRILTRQLMAYSNIANVQSLFMTVFTSLRNIALTTHIQTPFRNASRVNQEALRRDQPPQSLAKVTANLT